MEVSTTQAAALIGKSERTIQRYIKDGTLTARKLADGRYMVDVKDLESLRGDQADIEALRIEVEALKQRVSDLEEQVKALSSRPYQYEQKPAPVRVIRESAGPATPLPDGLIALSDMMKRHGVPETSVRRAVENGALPVVRGSWPGGVKQAIDSEGHRKFYALYHERPGFERCDQCPHL